MKSLKEFKSDKEYWYVTGSAQKRKRERRDSKILRRLIKRRERELVRKEIEDQC